MSLDRDFNHARFEPGSRCGFYESYFQRANHPSRPLAFWIRYTLFAPRDRPHDAIGELRAIWFDGERNRTVVGSARHRRGGSSARGVSWAPEGSRLACCSQDYMSVI